MSSIATAAVPAQAASIRGVRQATRPSVIVYQSISTREPETELHYGEEFTVIEERQKYSYGYTTGGLNFGFVEKTGLGPFVESTHRVAIPLAPIYSAPDTRASVMLELPMNSLIRERRPSSEKGWACVERGYVADTHIAPRHVQTGDPAQIARMFCNAAYRWGGRNIRGIDCSGLIGEALLMSHHLPTRHSADWMAEHLGDSLLLSQEPADLKRNDLVFWKGHVAMMLDGQRAIHATGRMKKLVVEQDLADIIRERNKKKNDPITALRRLPPPTS